MDIKYLILKYKYFGPEIVNNVPIALRWLSLYFLIIGLTGSLLI